MSRTLSDNLTPSSLKVGEVGYASVLAWLADGQWKVWIFANLRLFPDRSNHHNLKVELTAEGLVCELQSSKIQRHPSTEISQSTHLPVAYLVVDGVKHRDVPESLRLKLPQ